MMHMFNNRCKRWYDTIAQTHIGKNIDIEYDGEQRKRKRQGGERNTKGGRKEKEKKKDKDIEKRDKAEASLWD